MSDAPGRIWIDSPPMTYIDKDVIPSGEWDSVNYDCDKLPQVEYVRADLAGMPDDLVAEIRAAMPLMRDRVSALMHRVLAWHERQKGGGR